MNLSLKYNPIIEHISSVLNHSRFIHTLSVAETAYSLGKKFLMTDTECEKLYVAGLLHDITKPLSRDKHIETCHYANVLLTADDLASPPVLHAISGAIVAKARFPDFVDDSICHAIACHTTGKCNMTLFDKLLYLADYIEPERQNTACVSARAAFWKDLAVSQNPIQTLNYHLLQITKATKQYILSQGNPLHPKTNETITFLEKELEQ